MQEHPLRAYRQKHGLTLEAFAAIAKASAPTISRIETGQAWPAPALMRRLLDATGGDVTADAILAAVKREEKANEAAA